MSAIAFRSTHAAALAGLAEHQAQQSAVVNRVQVWLDGIVARFGNNPDGSPRTVTTLRLPWAPPLVIGISGSGTEAAVLAAGFKPAEFPLRGYVAGESNWQEMAALTRIDTWPVPGAPRECKVAVDGEEHRAPAVAFGADGAAYIAYPTDERADVAATIRAAVAAQSEADGIASVWEEVAPDELEQVVASLRTTEAAEHAAT